MPKKREHYHGDDDDINNKYMFHNTLLDISLFTYADGYQQRGCHHCSPYR